MKIFLGKPIVRLTLVSLVVILVNISCNLNVNKAGAASEATTAENIEPMRIRNNYIPATISPEAKETLKAIYKIAPFERAFPEADDLEGWRKMHDEAEVNKKEANEKIVEKFQVKIVDEDMGGVPVVHIYPKDWKDNGKVFVYVHGGAYTMFSAHSTLNSAVPMADATGLHIVSVDYTNPPFARWDEIQEQVITVFKTLLKQGFTMADIAIYGDSAGGGLAMSTIHNLRDEGMGLPAAAVFMSPWSDLSLNGDTYHTIENTDPTLSGNMLVSSAKAYANGLDLTDPRVSPVYGDFAKGYSPSLITEGTKCVFLSNSVRAYQAIEASGVEAKLDIYEGMWHVFQINNLDMPESKTSFGKIATFVNGHLNKK